MRVLFAASEVYPYAKTGGLADVADALPRSLKKYVDISVVMPLYGFLSLEGLKQFAKFELDLGGVNYETTVYKKSNHYFIHAPLLSTTEHLYGENGSDYASNDVRFGIFSKAIAQLCEVLVIDILHINDWHTALSALFLKQKELKTKSLFTIHNLAYQGLFPKESMARIGFDAKYFTIDALEFYGQINFLKAGIAFSDALTTVSPTYAHEILTSEFGCGLDGFLRCHEYKLRGILNGINTDVFDPQKDPYLEAPYSSSTLDEKYKNKVAFLKHSKLKDPRRPLFVMLSRLVAQKGIDLLIDALPKILEQKVNLFILGEGESDEIAKLVHYASIHPNFEFKNCYDAKLSHQAYGAADFLLMPSVFEPCGLSQIIAMRYGVIPVVYATGGLKDTVFEDEQKCGRGIVFTKYSKNEFLFAIERALMLKKDDTIKKANMECDFSFDKSALEYLKIYKGLL
jgi:starch synthase